MTEPTGDREENGQSGLPTGNGLVELLYTFRDEMVALARRFSPDHGEDWAHEALVKAEEKLGQFRGYSVAEFQSWVRVSVRRHCLSAMRPTRANSVKQLAVDEEVAQRPGARTPSEFVREQEERDRLAAMLDLLTEAEREVVFYRYFEGWKIAEIANQMARSTEAVGGLLARGLRKLRNHSSPSEWSRLL